MICLEHKGDCCGCSACAQLCPTHAIAMEEDNEGFLYPRVDVARCVSCGLCQRVCPVINQSAPRQPLAQYAAKHRDDAIRLRSSSGGVFTLVAESVIAAGGVVFGAKFDAAWNVVHDSVDTPEALGALRGSKYVQSRVGDSYISAKRLLDDGRKVLFTGTPCQISGLKHALRRDYDNLYTMEVACHGVPSPRVWRDYLGAQRRKMQAADITAISFRDKSESWRRYNVRICFAQRDGRESCMVTPYRRDLFMRGFLKDIYLRPSCYRCAAKGGSSGADLTIADYWGVEHYHQPMDDDRGVGLVLVNSSRGAALFNDIAPQMEYAITEYANALHHNPCIAHSVSEPPLRAKFWAKYDVLQLGAIEAILKELHPTGLRRMLNKIKHLANKLLKI